MNQNITTLIIAPHIDDEVLGCFSRLSPESFVCYMGVEERSYVSAAERVEELKKAADKTGFTWKLFNNTVNNYQTQTLIGQIEEQINTIKPHSLFIPHYSYNQDHRAVYDAALTASRPHDTNHFITGVFVYEQPHTILWPHKHFEPNYFIPINIEDKIATYRLYDSQVRGQRSPEIIRALAKIRGAQSNVPYAEGFTCIRLVHS